MRGFYTEGGYRFIERRAPRRRRRVRALRELRHPASDARRRVRPAAVRSRRLGGRRHLLARPGHRREGGLLVVRSRSTASSIRPTRSTSASAGGSEAHSRVWLSWPRYRWWLAVAGVVSLAAPAQADMPRQIIEVRPSASPSRRPRSRPGPARRWRSGCGATTPRTASASSAPTWTSRSPSAAAVIATVTFTAKAGRYTFECSRLCGAGHEFMRGVIVAVDVPPR